MEKTIEEKINEIYAVMVPQKKAMAKSKKQEVEEWGDMVRLKLINKKKK